MRVTKKRAACQVMAALVTTGTLTLSAVAPSANAWVWSPRADVYGKSCGGNYVDWVAYSAYSGGGGSVEGIGNDFMIPLTTVPLTGTTLTMTVKCGNGSWHDVDRHVNRPSSGFSYGIGWV